MGRWEGKEGGVCEWGESQAMYYIIAWKQLLDNKCKVHVP